MNRCLCALTAIAVTSSVLVPASVPAANYAVGAAFYEPGAGTNPDYSNPFAAVGEPSRETPGEFGGPVDPFNAAWKPFQLLSIGAGGSVMVRFQGPVFDLPGNPFGLDFSIFTSSAFVITNGDYSGGGITDGSLFGDNPGTTRVSVSVNGDRFYVLDPRKAPTVDGLFPTDGQGSFERPVDPALRPSDFSGLTLEGIRAKYAGSAGGTGYDLAWAIDDQGQPVSLNQIEYVRVEVLSGRADIDGFAAVPEPGVVRLFGVGLLGCGLLARSKRRSVANATSR